jgi:hypothetical protein
MGHQYESLEHLHPLAATGTPTGAGPVPNRVPGRGSWQPPTEVTPAPGSRQTLNSALNTVFPAAGDVGEPAAREPTGVALFELSLGAPSYIHFHIYSGIFLVWREEWVTAR